MRFEHSESEVVEKAYELTPYNLHELVGNEVYDWEGDKLEQEACESASIIVSEAPYHHSEIHQLIIDRALTLWQNDLGRIERDLVNVESDKELVFFHGFWPNKMNKWECREILESVETHEIPTECYNKAMQEVERGIVKKLKEIPEQTETN